MRLNTPIQLTFQKCWEKHPNKDFTAHLDTEKLHKLFKTVEQENLWDCGECSFVGYVLLRCEMHQSKAWANTLIS